MNALLSAVVGHLVGDYLLQNDWMALNKKRPGCVGMLACMIHSFIWTNTVLLFSGWNQLWCFCALYTLHYGQDRTNVVVWWMTKVNRQQQFTQPPLGPWSVIVVDNAWHIVTLWIVAHFV